MRYAKIFVLALMLAFLPAVSAFAAEQQTRTPLGLYVGGKLGFTHYKMGSHKLKYEERDWTYADRSYGNGSFNDSTYAASFVAGYNFEKRFDLPFRVDFEATVRGGKDKTYRNNSLLYESGPGGGSVVFNTVYEMDIENVSSAMLNGWFDFPLGDSPVRPYIGFGFGIIGVTYDSDFYVLRDTQSMSKDIDGTEAAAAWSIGAGVAWDLGKLLTLDFGYRYIDSFGKIEIELLDAHDSKITSKFNIRSHDVMLGLRFNF